jgi:hypothetical protein
MSVKFKLSPTASEACVREVLDALTSSGLTARRLFPDQERPALARMFIVRASNTRSEVAKVLARFGSDVEYVETDVERKPRGKPGR